MIRFFRAFLVEWRARRLARDAYVNLGRIGPTQWRDLPPRVRKLWIDAARSRVRQVEQGREYRRA